MKIIKPGFEFITPINGSVILKRLEECGRVCYKSEGKITDDSAPKFVAGIIKRGHEAVLEHCSFTVKFVCDRGVSHEIVSTGWHPIVRRAPATVITERISSAARSRSLSRAT